MKTKIFYLALLFACVTTSQAQTNYYKETKTFKGEGYEYQCDVQHTILVTLHNKADNYSAKDIVYKETGETFDDGSLITGADDLAVVEPAKAMLDGSQDIVSSAFTEDETEKFGDREMIITLYIDSDKGDVIGVHFNFSNRTGYANVPVSKYREIELKLKKYIHFTPTELGRQLKVIMICWSQRPGVFKLPPSPLRPVED